MGPALVAGKYALTPAARVQAAIDLLDRIRAGTPAEKALTGWARRARYAGSGDRAAVRDHVFDALRCWRSFACLGGGETGRAVMIGALRAAGRNPAEIFTGAGHGPTPLEDEEASAGAPPEEPGARLDLPDWLLPRFRDSLGDAAETTALALKQRAPVMLRVNLRKADPGAAIRALDEDGVTVSAHPVAPTALHVTGGARRVSSTAAYRNGIVELQDASSQAAMQAVPVPDGARVLDYCAGGGGKTLALAARATATWYAHDAQPRRMADLPNRAARAGVEVVLCGTADLGRRAPYDVVLCDVPCSGSGTWRRNPEAKWRLTPERLAELEGLQARILEEAAALVAPKGVLAYATCSVLAAENGGRVRAFEREHPGWRCTLQRDWPVSDAGDGFFIALFERAT